MSRCSVEGCEFPRLSYGTRCRDHHNESLREYHRQPHVREKRRWKHFERTYGLTKGAYQALLASQDGACATCGAIVDLCVDHDHETGAVRGILCGRCNKALGLTGDNPDTLRALVDYLESD